MDYDARLPIPFSAYPASYATNTHTEEHIKEHHEPHGHGHAHAHLQHHDHEHREDHLVSSSHSHDSFAREDAQSVTHSAHSGVHSGAHSGTHVQPVEVHIEETHKHYHLDGHDNRERIKEKIHSHLPHLPGHGHHGHGHGHAHSVHGSVHGSIHGSVHQGSIHHGSAHHHGGTHHGSTHHGSTHHGSDHHHLALVHKSSHHKEDYRPYTGTSKTSDSSSSSSSDSSKSTVKAHGLKHLLPAALLHKHDHHHHGDDHHHHQDNQHTSHHTVADYKVAQPLTHSVTHTKIEEHYTVDKPQLALTPYPESHTPALSYTADPPTFDTSVSQHTPSTTTHETYEFKDIHVKHKPDLKLKDIFSHDKKLLHSAPPYPAVDTMVKHDHYDEHDYAHSTSSHGHGHVHGHGLTDHHHHKTHVSSVHAPKSSATFTIPCHHIRIGDLVILQHRPCQIIRITTSAQTGQHRYLGVDLFTKQLHEEPCVVSHPSPSVVLHSLLGPVFKQYRLIDIRDDGRLVCMTETGEIKQGLKVVDQGNLIYKMKEAFGKGSGAVRCLVISDHGKELAVDFKHVHMAHKL